MIINILCQGFQMTKDEQAHAERQLDVAVGRGLPHVTSVVITISDANSLRGRFDNRYCIIAWIEGRDWRICLLRKKMQTSRRLLTALRNGYDD